MTLEGGCICGKVRYRIEEEDPPAYACHCTDCQTHTGSGFALQMPVWASKLVIEGETVTGERTMPSATTGTIHVCPGCLVRLYAKNSGRPEIAVVRAGTLDDSRDITPVAHMWVGSKQPWLSLPDAARRYDTQPADVREWSEILKLERRPQ